MDLENIALPELNICADFCDHARHIQTMQSPSQVSDNANPPVASLECLRGIYCTHCPATKYLQAVKSSQP